jgi:hypothetical protein
VGVAYPRNPTLDSPMLPVDIVLGPAWWHRHAGIDFDEDFFFHPAKRVEAERKMERVLYERFGRYGLGADHDRDVPVVGAVHLAAGYIISDMLGCQVDYVADGPPQVRAANLELLDVSPERAFQSAAYKKLTNLVESLKARYGYLAGDVNWGGVLNAALDLRGQNLFMDFFDAPEATVVFLKTIAEVVERFATEIGAATGSTSISVNRNVRNIPKPVFLHSECSLVMTKTADYERFLFDIDAAWSRRHRPFGIHYCGQDPHRYAEVFARLPHLDFLDVGWGGDVAVLRSHLPGTFFNLRYSPVEIIGQTPDQIRTTVRRLVEESANPWLTGVCAINMDDQVSDQQISAIFDEVAELRAEYAAASP